LVSLHPVRIPLLGIPPLVSAARDRTAGVLQRNGHSVKVQDFEDIDPIKKMAGVPEMFQSCHTAMVDGYVVEGHVPAKDVERLLKQRQKARGIAVPGMVAGSPGMEQGPPERYDVLLFQSDGTSSVFARY